MNVIPNIDILDDFLFLAKEAAARQSFTKTPGKTPKQTAELKSLQKKEMELWHGWNNNGRKAKDLKPLFDSYKPMIQRSTMKFISGTRSRVEIPTSAIHAEMRKQFVKAVKSYEPKKGVLSSWVGTHLLKVSRFVKTYQNVGKMPEGNIAKMKEFQRAQEELLDKFGYEPDTKTLADHLKWSPKRVSQMLKENRKDLPSSQFEHDTTEQFTPKELEAVHLLQYDTRLGNEERTVYEHVFGINGKPRLAPGEIAKKTGIHPSKVSRIRTKLKGYIQEAIEVL
jgi:DNA-directed RNA polymerase specialized sigma subunit